MISDDVRPGLGEIAMWLDGRISDYVVRSNTEAEISGESVGYWWGRYNALGDCYNKTYGKAMDNDPDGEYLTDEAAGVADFKRWVEAYRDSYLRNARYAYVLAKDCRSAMLLGYADGAEDVLAYLRDGSSSGQPVTSWFASDISKADVVCGLSDLPEWCRRRAKEYDDCDARLRPIAEFLERFANYEMVYSVAATSPQFLIREIVRRLSKVWNKPQEYGKTYALDDIVAEIAWSDVLARLISGTVPGVGGLDHTFSLRGPIHDMILSPRVYGVLKALLSRT